MEHPTEYAIEQYVLNAPEGRTQAAEIAAHLAACSMCSLLAAEIREFYSVTASRLEEDVRPEQTSDLPAILHREIVRRPQFHPLDTTPLPVRATFHEKLALLVRQHPVASTVTFAGSIAAALLAGLLLSSPRTDKEPAYATLNFRDAMLAVHNAKNQVVFTAPWARFWTGEMDAMNKVTTTRRFLVVRREGTEENILVTSLSLGEHADGSALNVVRFITGAGDEIGTLPVPSGHVSFRSRPYEAPMQAVEVLVTAFSPRGASELVTRYNDSRSPCVLQRADFSGHVLGEYWHFGALYADTVDVDLDGNREILAWGLNDVDDYKRLGDPVLVVIDPRQIVNVCESSASRGFGFPASRAERYYIAFPLPDAALAASVRMMPTSIRRFSSRALDVFLNGEVSPAEGVADRTIGYDAIIDSTMRVVQIKPNDALIDLHRKLYEQGRLKESLSDGYFQRLASRTRYWNGRTWTETVSPVAHDTPDSASH